MRRKTDRREAALGVLWAAWWLHSAHGLDSVAQEMLRNWGGRSGLRGMQQLARVEQYEFTRGFWAEALRTYASPAAAAPREGEQPTE